MNLRLLCPAILIGTALTAALYISTGTAAEPATAAATKKKILFFTKSSGFEHSVISWKNGKPSWAEKQLMQIGDKNGWEFSFPRMAHVQSGISEGL
jgi:hypothetical protein